MLTALAPREVETFGVAETSEFSIKANGKAFKVLIDGLYSDKIRAVIREIWSNAFDSHIAAGKDAVPFDCHLPTQFEPYFSVRDYGVSLSHSGVMRLYTTVFESTKEDSNSQVGKLGLGSKSPFAYVDTFTVTAWLDGRKRLYSAYIGEDYIPRISLMDETESDEPQGLEISFPVKSGDIYDFRIAAQRTALGFDVLPNIVGSDQLEKATRSVLAEGPGWKLYSTSDYGLRAHAKQGCVVYPIDPTAVVGLSSTQSSLLKSCLFIDFPIGELEITASREGLGYDEQTCKNIVARLDTIEKDIISQIEAQIAASATWYEAVIKAKELRGSDIPECVQQLLDRVKFKGKGLQNSFYLGAREIRGVDVAKYARGVMSRRRSLAKHATRGSMYIDPTNTRVYFHRTDVPVPQALSRIQHHWDETHGAPDVLVVRGMPGSMGFKRLLVSLGRPDPATFVDVTKLEKPPANASYSERKPVKVRHLTGTSSDFRDWPQVDASGGVYVGLERNTLVNNEERVVSVSSVRDIVAALVTAGVLQKTDPIYVVPKTLARITKDEAWVNLFTLAQETLDENYDEASAKRLYHLDYFLDERYMYRRAVEFLQLFKIMSYRGDTVVSGPAQLAIAEIDALRYEQGTLAPHRGYLELARALNKFDTPSDFDEDLVEVDQQQMRARYPLLAELLNHVSVSDIINSMDPKILADYVSLIDAPAP